jgi:hypothetical protein
MFKSKKIQEFSMFDPIVAWEEYTHLEKGFLKYLRYVPLSKEHYNV